MFLGSLLIVATSYITFVICIARGPERISWTLLWRHERKSYITLGTWAAREAETTSRTLWCRHDRNSSISLVMSVVCETEPGTPSCSLSFTLSVCCYPSNGVGAVCVCVCMCVSVCLSIYLSVCLFVCLSVCMSGFWMQDSRMAYGWFVEVVGNWWYDMILRRAGPRKLLSVTDDNRHKPTPAQT